MLLIVNLAAKGSIFPLEALQQVDAALEAAGLQKQVRSALIPGKEYSTSYEGARIERDRVEEALRPLAEKNNISFSVEIEESVKFP